jgi:bifunctional non-homologous end joining protein LigD
VEVEDHPLDYGDFEGTIPKGQYGGGTVMVWDRGFWNCDDPGKAYRKGKLDFTLEGEKLRGGWILTRMRSREGEKRTNWLMIKHRDAFAHEGKKNTILDEDASVASGRSMDDIAAGKGRGPKAFITGSRSRASAKAEWTSHRAASNASTTKKLAAACGPIKAAIDQKGHQEEASLFRGRHSGLRGAATVRVGGASSRGRRLGP